MSRMVRTTLVFGLLSILLFAFYFLHLFRNAISENELRYSTSILTPRSKNFSLQYAVRANHDSDQELGPLRTRRVSSIGDSIATVSVLLPDWQVLVIVSSETEFSPGFGKEYACLFQNNATSPARLSGVLAFSNQTTFKCLMPNSVRRLRKFLQPILSTQSEKESPVAKAMPKRLIRWTFLAYESYSTEDDVVLFVKGLNHRQGFNRTPGNFRCVFGDGTKAAAKTAVTSSIQEVFRCDHPNLTAVGSDGYDGRIQISLEIVAENLMVPSVAHYKPPRRLRKPAEPRSLLCACAMVYNVAKFLKEWVTYHSSIGVHKFILYDNDSDDDLGRVVKELNQEGYNVTTLFWIWPKTQEAGFSHGAIYAKESCTWMMYLDVDEFVFSPSWHSSVKPTNSMLTSLLPRTPPQLPPSSTLRRWIGQVMVRCNEFGPSNRTSHPVEGVTQGYTCRKKVEQRHKSIVLLDAIDSSLRNAVHHFQLNENFRSKTLSMGEAVINHYKYQAWSEFRTKFRRRVSTYVVDWTKAANPHSKDRTPGLGFEAIEPEGWAEKFCEVRDNRLELLTKQWFGSHTSHGYEKLAWQSCVEVSSPNELF